MDSASDEIVTATAPPQTTTAATAMDSQVIEDMKDILAKDASKNNEIVVNEGHTKTSPLTHQAIPVAALQALLGVIKRSRAETMMGLQEDLKQATTVIIDYVEHNMQDMAFTLIPLTSACNLFLQYSTRTYLEWQTFEECRQAVLDRATRFWYGSTLARSRLVQHAASFFQGGMTILTHGYSQAVAALLANGLSLRLIILEGRPYASGCHAAQELYATRYNIPTHIVLDAAMGYYVEQCDFVLVGAEAVVENGGVINQVGTYALAACAQAAGKPVYVAAESFKFARHLYPLHQRDVPLAPEPITFCDTNNKSEPKAIELDASIETTSTPVDFTPAKLITLLFTDLGVLTPSAVSDELIRLYQ